MRRFLAGGMILVAAAFTAAGAVSADTSYWVKRAHPTAAIRPVPTSNGYGRPVLSGTIVEVSGNALSVREGSTVYRVYISGASRRSLHRGDRVMIWGRRNSHSINAERIQILGGGSDSSYNRRDNDNRYDRYNRRDNDNRYDRYNRQDNGYRYDRYNRRDDNEHLDRYNPKDSSVHNDRDNQKDSSTHNDRDDNQNHSYDRYHSRRDQR